MCVVLHLLQLMDGNTGQTISTACMRLKHESHAIKLSEDRCSAQHQAWRIGSAACTSATGF